MINLRLDLNEAKVLLRLLSDTCINAAEWREINELKPYLENILEQDYGLKWQDGELK